MSERLPARKTWKFLIPVTRSFFVCATPQSGSSLLSEALEFTMIAGRPREYFEPAYEKDWCARLGVSADTQYVEKFLAAGTTPNGVFGAKVHWHQFVHLRAKLRLIQGGVASDLELLRRTFPDLKYVFLTRRDRIRQAVSYDRAIRSGVWWSVSANAYPQTSVPPSAPAPLFAFEKIDDWVTRLTEFESNWRRYFKRIGVEPFEVAYEDLVENHESTVHAILRYLDLPISEARSIAPPRLRKQADEVTEEWVQRYRELKQCSLEGEAARNLTRSRLYGISLTLPFTP